MYLLNVLKSNNVSLTSVLSERMKNPEITMPNMKNKIDITVEK